MDIPLDQIICHDVSKGIPLPDECIDVVITSPPYWGLRCYGKNTISIFGGDPKCRHEWLEDKMSLVHENRNNLIGTQEEVHNKTGVSFIKKYDTKTAGLCSKCGAWYGQLGLEPHPQDYINHLVDICKEIKRVLKRTGSFYLNLGDTYYGGGQGGGNKNAWKGEGKKYAHLKHKSDGAWLQAKQLLLVPSRVAIALQNDGWICRNDIVWHKCLASGTPVYAKSQRKILRTSIRELARLPMNDLWVHGLKRWIRVISIERQPKRQLLTIHLRNGTKIEATPEHRFLVKNELIEASSLRMGYKLDHAHFGDEKGTPLGIYDNGWIVGLFLAEGNYETDRDAIRFSLHKKEHQYRENVKKFAEKYAAGYREWSENNINCPIVTGKVPTAIIRHYVSGEGSKKKHLSRFAFNESNAFLKGILDGWLAGDGCYDEKNRRFRFKFTLNRELEYDVKTICNRLNFFVRSRLRRAKGFGEEYPCIDMEIRQTRTGHYNQKDDYEIKRIIKTVGYSYEISVDSEDHLFLLFDGTITHNCNHMPSSVKDRMANSWEHVFHFVKQQAYYYDLDAIREPHKASSLARAKYDFNLIPRAWKQEAIPISGGKNINIGCHPAGKNPGDTVQYNSKYQKVPDDVASERRLIGKVAFDRRVRGVPHDLGGCCPSGKNPGDVMQFDEDYWWKFVIGNANSNKFYKKAYKLMKEWMIKNNCFDYNVFYEWYKRDFLGKWESGSLKKGKANYLSDEKRLPFPKPETRFLGDMPGDFWDLTTRPFTGYSEDLEHFAVFPEELVVRPLLASCPRYICKKCGKIKTKVFNSQSNWKERKEKYGATGGCLEKGGKQQVGSGWSHDLYSKQSFIGYNDCGCNKGFDSGVVLDLFCGRGTVGKVAKRLGFHYIMIDIKPEYCELARLYMAGQKHKLHGNQKKIKISR